MSRRADPVHEQLVHGLSKDRRRGGRRRPIPIVNGKAVPVVQPVGQGLEARKRAVSSPIARVFLQLRRRGARAKWAD